VPLAKTPCCRKAPTAQSSSYRILHGVPIAAVFPP
jgi:hypothetical protein